MSTDDDLLTRLSDWVQQHGGPPPQSLRAGFEYGEAAGAVLQPQEAGLNVTTGTGSNGTFVYVPGSALGQYSGTALLIKWIVETTSPAFYSGRLDGIFLVGGPLYIDFFDLATQEPVEVHDVPEPIMFSVRFYNDVGADLIEEAECAFWSVELGRWSTEGVRKRGVESRIDGLHLICETQHLSIFGALVNTLACVNVVVFDPTGLEELSDSWGGPVWVLWGGILAAVALLLWSAYRDYGDWLRKRWSNEHFIQDIAMLRFFAGSGMEMDSGVADQFSDLVDSAGEEVLNTVTGQAMACIQCLSGKWLPSLLFHLVDKLMLARGSTSSSARTPRGVARLIAEASVASCAIYAISARTSQSPSMVQLYFAGERPPEEPEAIVAASRSFGRGAETLQVFAELELAAEEAVNSYFRSGYCAKICTAFSVCQPWLELRCHDILMPRMHRQLVMMLDLSAELLLTMLWFEVGAAALAKETSLDWREVKECPPMDLLVALVVNAVLAFVVRLVLIVPIHLVSMLHQRQFVACQVSEVEDTAVVLDRRAKSRLWRWKVQDAAMWVISLSFFTLCALLITNFFINVAGDVQRDFLFSVSIYLFEWYFLNIIEGVVCTVSVASYAQRYHPELTREAVQNVVQMNRLRWLRSPASSDNDRSLLPEVGGAEEGGGEEGGTEAIEDGIMLDLDDEHEVLPNRMQSSCSSGSAVGATVPTFTDADRSRTRKTVCAV